MEINSVVENIIEYINTTYNNSSGSQFSITVEDLIRCIRSNLYKVNTGTINVYKFITNVIKKVYISYPGKKTIFYIRDCFVYNIVNKIVEEFNNNTRIKELSVGYARIDKDVYMLCNILCQLDKDIDITNLMVLIYKILFTKYYNIVTYRSIKRFIDMFNSNNDCSRYLLELIS